MTVGLCEHPHIVVAFWKPISALKRVSLGGWEDISANKYACCVSRVMCVTSLEEETVNGRNLCAEWHCILANVRY